MFSVPGEWRSGARWFTRIDRIQECTSTTPSLPFPLRPGGAVLVLCDLAALSREASPSLYSA